MQFSGVKAVSMDQVSELLAVTAEGDIRSRRSVIGAC